MSEPNKDEGIGNLFKIIDGIVYQLHRTKRMFIIMILTVMILPPVSLFVASHARRVGSDAAWIRFRAVRPSGWTTRRRPVGQLELGDGHGRPPPGIGGRDPYFSFVRQLPLIISIVWLGVGIYQWHVLSKWTKRYDRYKEKQRRAEEKLGGSNDDVSEQGSS